MLLLVSLYSCEKEDKALPGRFLRDQIGRVDMVSQGGVDYPQQVYFDLGSGQVKAQNSRDAWDLALSCKKDTPNLFVNPAMLEAVANTGSMDFNADYDPSGYNFKYERPDRFYHHGWMADDFEISGEPKGTVFIIDMGRDLQNQKRDYKLLRIKSYSSATYTIQVSNLDHSDLREFQVSTDGNYNFLYVSLNDPGTILKLEPPKGQWDLLFTKYMERLYDGGDTLDYSVSGCLLNPWQTQAYFDEVDYKDSTSGYEQLTLDDLDRSKLTSQQNIIGYDWKSYDINAGAYVVLSRKVYFIKDSESFYYRLHFTGFYDESGHKGAVTFEYLPL